MQYAERMVNSMEELPCYSGVEHEVTPLGSGHSLAKIQSATAKKAGFYKETFFNRLRYKEVQTGDAIHVGLLVPGREPIRFDGIFKQKPFVVCWQGNPRKEFEYIVEDGSIEYIIEIRRDVVSSRGWRLPEQPFIEFEAGNVRAFVNDFQKILHSAAKAQGDILVSFESLAAEKIELLCGDGLFGKTRYEQEMRSSRLHRKIVAEVEFLLLNDDAELDWSGDKLCHALGVPRRTLYDAFKNYLGIGPQEFHRRLRLLQLRRLLIAAVAERGAITQLMGQAGFSHLGRTSVEYRKLFGETPNETLNR